MHGTECYILSSDQILTSSAGGRDALDAKLNSSSGIQPTVQSKGWVAWPCLPHWPSILRPPTTYSPCDLGALLQFDPSARGTFLPSVLAYLLLLFQPHLGKAALSAQVGQASWFLLP